MSFKSEVVENMMLEHGQCLPLSMIGGYTLLYLDEHDHVLCNECATKESKDIKEVVPYFEGVDLSCHECSGVIEASYGDPEEGETGEEDAF